jgi:hypothetical protein
MAHHLGLYFNVPPLCFLEMQPVQKAGSSSAIPSSLHVSDGFLSRLKAQVALSGRKVYRRTKVIKLPDGTPVQTGE